MSFLAAVCHPERPHKAHGLCKPCYSRRWFTSHRTPEYLEHKRRQAANARRANPYLDIERKYGLSGEEFEAMASQQDGRCALCGCKPTRLSVDHDHITKRVRGLLRKPCNHFLGRIDEDIERITLYLQRGKL